jgi:hypothetical protein
LGSHISQADNVIDRKIGNEVIIIKDDGLSIHVLNETAAFIWQMCNGNNDSSAIATSICEQFDVPFEEASADVEDLIENLENLGILKQSGGTV